MIREALSRRLLGRFSPSVRRRLKEKARGIRSDVALPFDMFDQLRDARGEKSASKLANIYHKGQKRAWDGRAVLAQLLDEHGGIHLPAEQRHALAQIFAVILWGELAAWKISADLAVRLEPLEAKMAATSQTHDEARHFYVMHDYLEVLDEVPRSVAQPIWSAPSIAENQGVGQLVALIIDTNDVNAVFEPPILVPSDAGHGRAGRHELSLDEIELAREAVWKGDHDSRIAAAAARHRGAASPQRLTLLLRTGNTAHRVEIAFAGTVLAVVQAHRCRAIRPLSRLKPLGRHETPDTAAKWPDLAPDQICRLGASEIGQNGALGRRGDHWRPL